MKSSKLDRAVSGFVLIMYAVGCGVPSLDVDEVEDEASVV